MVENFIMNTETRNAKYNNNGDIDCEINHPVFGWIPFTASPYDVVIHSRIIFQYLVNNNLASSYIEAGVVNE